MAISAAHASHVPDPGSSIWRRGKTQPTWELGIPPPLVHQGSGDTATHYATPWPWGRVVQTSSARKCMMGSNPWVVGMFCRILLLDRNQSWIRDSKPRPSHHSRSPGLRHEGRKPFALQLWSTHWTLAHMVTQQWSSIVHRSRSLGSKTMQV